MSEDLVRHINRVGGIVLNISKEETCLFALASFLTGNISETSHVMTERERERER